MKKKLFLMTLIMAFSLAVSFCSYAGTNTTAYSPYWNIDSANNWHYTLASGQVVTDAWIQDEVSGDWYLIDNVGNMKSGLVTSNGKYYLLDNTRGTGHFGKLMKNGEYYNGVLILADTSASYQGALSESTLNQLSAIGLSIYSAENVTGTKQVTNGAIVSGGSSGAAMIGTTVSAPTLTQNNAAQSNTQAVLGATKAVVGATNAATVNTAGLEKYHRPDFDDSYLTQSEIDILVNQYGLQRPGVMGGTTPFSWDGVALMNYIDWNGRLVLAGDDVDANGCRDWGGQVLGSNLLHLQS